MKKIKIIYNPTSGRVQLNRIKLSTLTRILLDEGHILHKFATKKKTDAMYETIRACEEDWDLIIACGGDGTINEVATGIVRSGKKIPVAIFPSGTVNDFATYMNIPTNVEEFCKMISNGKAVDVDLGQLNDRYFVNVAAGGLLPSIAHKTSIESKTLFGRLAYYVEGLKDLQKTLNPIRVQIESDEYRSDEDIVLFLVSNSSLVGGFRNLFPTACVQDGLLDCMIIKRVEVGDIASLLYKFFSGDHVNHPSVSYFKTKQLTIIARDELELDVDGEYAGEQSADIRIIPASFRVLVNQ